MIIHKYSIELANSIEMGSICPDFEKLEKDGYIHGSND
jgi:hypothetical protein